jgi:hypothetical protein
MKSATPASLGSPALAAAFDQISRSLSPASTRVSLSNARRSAPQPNFFIGQVLAVVEKRSRLPWTLLHRLVGLKRKHLLEQNTTGHVQVMCRFSAAGMPGPSTP